MTATTRTRFIASNGWTVEPAVIDGLPQFIVRTPEGYQPYPLGLDPGPLTTLTQLAAYLDPTTLKEL